MTNKKGRPGQDGQNNSHIDFPTAGRFLQALDPMGEFTFQVFGDAVKDPALVRTMHGRFDQHRSELARLNEAGAGVFITVNRTNGKDRKTENIIGVRAVFLDLDGAPLPEEWPLEPHFLIESSPERYHAYWLVSEGFPLDNFEAVQKAIAQRFNGDPSVCDLPRVMRIPGFIHQKKEPFQSRILRDWSQEPRYSPDQILSIFPVSETKPPGPKLDSGNDPVLAKLTEKGLVIRQDRTEKGKFVIMCPWADRHTNGDSEAVYWLPNHGGFKGAGFKCLHGHCVNRTIKDLTEWLGLRKEPKTPEILTRKLSEVEAKPVEWLWPGYFPRGALCLIDGDPCLGKSFFTLDLAARVSAGKILPTGERATSGGVVLLSYEDDPGVTIRPRLEAMGADLNRVILLEGIRDEKNHPRLPCVADISAIREAVRSVDARLVVVDPLMAALPGAVDSHSDQNIRSVLAPLSKLAQETGATVLVVRHLNKSGGGNALYRGGGSIGIVAAARAAFMVGKDPKDDKKRILAATKLNIALEPPSLAYRIEVNAEGEPFLSWEGQSELSARDLLTPEAEPKRRPLKRDMAADFLLEILSEEAEVLQTKIESEGRKRGISEGTLKRAKTELSESGTPIYIRRIGGKHGHWVWSFERGPQPVPTYLDPFNNNVDGQGDFKGDQPQKEENIWADGPLYQNVENKGKSQRGPKCERGDMSPLKTDLFLLPIDL